MGVRCLRKTKPTELYNPAVLAHARWNGRKLVCRPCEEDGFSAKDCEAYRCGMCRPSGHLKFESQSLRNAKRPERKSKLVCLDCLQMKKTAEKKYRAALQHRDVWKCTCPSGSHIHSNEKCKLYPVQAGVKRWPGGNYNVTEDEWEFLERFRKYTKS